MTMYTESLRAFLKPVLPYLDDDSVSEIMINGPEDIWIERKGLLYRTDAKFSEEGLLGAARNMAQFCGRMLTDERPRLDARLPDGSRIHVVLPPIARKGTTVSIRKFFKDKLTIDGLLKFNSLTKEMGRVIEAGIMTKLNMIVSGGTGSGKTTLLNVVSSLIPNEERILTIEDSAELQLNQEHLVTFESRPPDKFGKGGVDMGDLLHSALRLRPDRIVVGEVRGGECFHLMQALNTGHGGSLATTHANTPNDTLRRLEALCLMSPIELPMVAVRAQVASAINFVICCERLYDGSRKVTALSEVLPLNEKGEYRTQDIFVYTPLGKDEDGRIFGYHSPTGIIPHFVGKARAYGFKDLDAAFFDPATYGLPPPPLFHVGEDYKVLWAPSLKHREKGVPDPESFAENYKAWEQKLKDQAEAARKARAAEVPASLSPAAKGKPAPAPAPAAKPAARPTPAAAAAQSTDADKTPPPTRNPLDLRRPEPLVEVNEAMLEEPEVSTDERAPLPRRPAGAPPARPVSNLRPATPPRRARSDDELGAQPDAETNVRLTPERPKR